MRVTARGSDNPPASPALCVPSSSPQLVVELRAGSFKNLQDGVRRDPRLLRESNGEDSPEIVEAECASKCGAATLARGLCAAIRLAALQSAREDGRSDFGDPCP